MKFHSRGIYIGHHPTFALICEPPDCLQLHRVKGDKQYLLQLWKRVLSVLARTEHTAFTDFLSRTWYRAMLDRERVARERSDSIR